MSRRTRVTGRKESGSYVALPHSLLRHPNFARLSPRATKLFLDLATCYIGNNNGDFSCAWSQMKGDDKAASENTSEGEKTGRGWKSKDQLYKALKELQDARFVIKSRQGGKHKCSLYALTIWPIDECKGKLDIASTKVASNAWKKSFSLVRHEDHIGPQRGPIKPAKPNVVPILARHEVQSR